MQAFLILFLSMWTGFQSSSLVAAPVPKNEFKIRITNEPETLDWNLAHTSMEIFLLGSMMEGLVSFDSNLAVKPQLAERYTISPDGKTYTFYLRKDVRWSDGIPLKAEDFVTSWKRLLSPTLRSNYSFLLFDVENAKDYFEGKITQFSAVGVSAPNPFELRIKLTKTTPYWIYIPSFWSTFPMRDDILLKYQNSWTKPGKMQTLGPYTLSLIEPEKRIVLKKNPYYYGAKGNVDQLSTQVIKDDQQALALYRAGELDCLTDLASSTQFQLQGNPDLKLSAQLKTSYLGFSQKLFPFTSAEFRKAIAQSIDRNAFTSIAIQKSNWATSFVPEPLYGFSKTLGYTFDRLKALDSLKKSGVSDPLSLKIPFIVLDNLRSISIAKVIQSELKKNLSITTEIKPLGSKAFWDMLEKNEAPLFTASWNADYPDSDNFLSIFVTGNGNNSIGFKNSKYDLLIENSRSLTDIKARDKNYLEAQKILLEQEAALVPLFFPPSAMMVKPRVKGFTINPLNQVNVRELRIN